MARQINTIKELVFWSYANLAMAHSAVSHQEKVYSRLSFIIRSRLFAGLMSGKMKLGPMQDDERVKIEYSDVCAYCGSEADISIDHLIPKIANGSNSADNLVRSCKHCNSSKGGKDLLEWHYKRNDFPSLLILRRYLKLVYSYCVEHDILDISINDAHTMNLPFNIKLIPVDYPAPENLVLYKKL
jgi:hypothetical protein